MAPRITTAVLGATLTLGITLFVHQTTFAVLVSVAAALAIFELRRLVPPTPLAWTAMVFAPAVPLAALGVPRDLAAQGAAVAACGVALAVPLAPSRFAFPLLAVGYVAGPLAVLVLLHRVNPAFALLVLAASWAGDIGGFLRSLRRPVGPPIWPAASRNKSLSGALCALLATTVAVTAWTFASPNGAAARDALALSLLMGVLGPAGDLIESRIKRRAGARHSGSLLGDQGGLLDCLDGLLFACPWAGLYLLVFVAR